MTPEDLEGLIALGATIDWQMIPENWLFTLRSFPRHSFVAEKDGRIIGSAVSYHYPPETAVISKVIVAHPFRRIGIAGNLIRRLMNSYPAGTSFTLDSSPHGTELYRKLGFTNSDFPGIRKLRTFDFKLPPQDSGEQALPLAASDLPEILRMDHEISGLNRAAVLEEYFSTAPELAFKMVKQGKLTGFCLGNRSGICREVCPLIAGDAADAKRLFRKAVEADSNHGIILDVPEIHNDFLDFLHAGSMTELMPLIRMQKGNLPKFNPDHYFSLLGSNLT